MSFKTQGYNSLLSIGQQLRTVGQGLESLDVEDFDLHAEGDGYFALGIPRSADNTATAPTGFAQASIKNTLQVTWHSLIGRSPADEKLPENASGVLRVLFTPEGLLRLELEGRAKRSKNSGGIPNLNRVAQVLRMVGEQLDTKSGRLLNASKRQDWISFEYTVDSGEHIKEQWNLSDLYKLWLDVSNQREERSNIVERELAGENDNAKIDELHNMSRR
jgi:hypothetical protein